MFETVATSESTRAPPHITRGRPMWQLPSKTRKAALSREQGQKSSGGTCRVLGLSTLQVRTFFSSKLIRAIEKYREAASDITDHEKCSDIVWTTVYWKVTKGFKCLLVPLCDSRTLGLLAQDQSQGLSLFWRSLRGLWLLRCWTLHVRTVFTTQRPCSRNKRFWQESEVAVFIPMEWPGKNKCVTYMVQGTET